MDVLDIDFRLVDVTFELFALADHLDLIESQLENIQSTVGWGEERTPTLCHETGRMQCDTGVRGLMAAHIFSPWILPQRRRSLLVDYVDVLRKVAGMLKERHPFTSTPW